MIRDKIIKYSDRVIEFSLCALVFYIPISRGLIESFFGLAFFAWIIKKIAIGKAGFKNLLYPSFLNIPIFIYVFVGLFSALFSTNQKISFDHLLFKTSEYLVIFFIIVEVADKRVIRNMIITLFFSVTLVGIDGIYQYFTHQEFLRHRQQDIPQRINGPFTSPTDFSNYLVTIFPLIVCLIFGAFKRKWIKFILVPLSLLIFVCLVLSVSKSAWIALVSSLVFIGFLGNRKPLVYILSLIIAVLCFYHLLPDMARSRIVHFFDFAEGGASGIRYTLWAMAGAMFADKPLLGQGLGTFMYNFQRFKPVDYPMREEGISYAHNCFLQMAAETGILGFLSFVCIITVLFFVSIKVVKKMKRDCLYYQLLSGLLMGIFAYLVSSFFDTNLYSLPLVVLFWVIVAIAVSATKIIAAQPK